MRLTFRRFLLANDGNVAIVTALLLPIVLGFGALGAETGVWLFEQQKMQDAADSAAVSASTGSYSSSSMRYIQAQAVANTYGFGPSSGATIQLNQPPRSGSYTGNSRAVEILIAKSETRLLSAVLRSDPVTITARAVALNQGGQGCVLGLDSSASGTVSTQGSASVQLTNCSLYDNSASGSALTASGSSTITAGLVSVTGGIVGASSITTTNGTLSHQPAVADPYADVTLPAFSGCNQIGLVAHNAVTLSPGVYCNGFTASAGAVVTFSPGVYVIDGGAFSVMGGATLQGTGVTLVFTSSLGTNWPTVSINGGATINLVAPSSGAMAGIVLYGDRNMPAGTAYSMSGGSAQYFGGAVYLPRAALSFSGGAGASTNCTQIVADTIKFSGLSTLSLNCSGLGTRDIGATATLVE